MVLKSTEKVKLGRDLKKILWWGWVVIYKSLGKFPWLSWQPYNLWLNCHLHSIKRSKTTLKMRWIKYCLSSLGYSKGPQLLPREVLYIIDLMTRHLLGGLRKSTLRILYFPPGSASFLLSDNNKALISSSVMGLSWMGNLKIRVNRGRLVQPLSLSSFQFGKGADLDGHGQNLWVFALKL